MRRILTIDGGGVKGTFSAACLARLEAHLDRPLIDYFDLIAGTSTGGLITLSLGLGYSAARAMEKYAEAAPRIFRKSGVIGHLRHVITSKYGVKPLQEELAAHFGERLLGESRCRLLVPTMDVTRNHVHVFKTSHHPSLFKDIHVSAIEVCLAAVSAPSYFPIHRTHDGAAMIDGSLWAHNPTLLAVIEAVGLLGWPREEISVLSLGFPPEPLPYDVSGRRHVGAYEASFRLADLLMNAQSTSALVNARLLISQDRVVRVTPEAGWEAIALDGIESLPVLKQLGLSAGERVAEQHFDTFFSEPAEPFVPCNKLEPIRHAI